MFDDDHVSLLPPPSDAGASGDSADDTEILIDLVPALLTTTIESAGATSLVHVDTTFFLDPSGGGTGPLLKFGGAAVTDGQFGGWAPIGAEQVGGGYRVAWKFGSADLYQVWSVDGAGNYLASGSSVSGGTYLLQSAEVLFQQDFNGDSTTGLVTTVIETTGSTTLTQVGDRYHVGPTGGPIGPELSAFGAPVFAGEFGAFLPVAAEATASGYAVAWKATGADQYTVLNADSSGVFQSHAFFVVSGGSLALQSAETLFQQNLNGDGSIGVVTSTVESAGVTALKHVADTYSLDPVGGGTGPQLKFGGAAVTDGEFGAWTPVGGEQVGNGYRVVWKFGSADLYQVWSVDGGGNYLSSGASTSGGSYLLQSAEGLFQQNLNGDGTTGLVTTTVEAAGVTALVHVGDTYLLNPVGGGTGPQLKFGGAAVTDGEFGAWTPIGAEQVGGGYRVVWKFGSADQYQVWSLDGGGNYVSSGATTSGGSYLLESAEVLFQQNLNGDGVTGLLTSTVESAGVTALVHVGDTYLLNPVGGGTGPQLKFGGAAVTDGEFGAWTPIGAEQVGGGYRVVWKFGSADQYQVWSLDGGGNYVSSGATTSGGSYLLESAEALFQQNLNGDGTTGLVTTTIESLGSAVLAQAADTYTINGVPLKLSGAVVTVGQFGGWEPIAAEPIAGGYQVAWKLAGTSQYSIWTTDSAGNYLGDIGAAASGSYRLTSREVGFQQNLNGDGLIGSPTTVLESFGSIRLTQVADTYFLNTSGGTGPQLSIGGVLVTAGLFGGWAPIGAEQVGSGYQVAWKLGADQYKVWTTNAGGGYLGDSGQVSAGSYRLTSRETAFQQDLNGDGLTGSPTTVLETFGTIRLTQVADTYFLNNLGGSGPQLNMAGAEVTVGQFGAWTPIGAELHASGYRIAWKFGSADQYQVWSADGNGTYITDTGSLSGSSVGLRSLERALNQDLNGDTQIATSSVVESVGSTVLTQVLGTYFLNTANGLWGPQVTGGGTAIGAELTGNAYVVAWKYSADQYSVWTVNPWGSLISQTGVLSGSSTALQSLEPSFGQDLNGDGTIGVTHFDITINYTGDSAYQSYFTAAARRWEQVITGDLPNVNSSTYGFIDDLLITANVRAIDGPGRILGQAGPDAFRSGSLLPTHGVMTFDSADLASMASNGTLPYVILHEMGHVLGIGTLWDALGLKSGFNYTGANGIAAFRQLSGNGGAGSVPLETTGGSGTAGVHWSESVFANELMTGFIGGVPDPLSILTIGALRDLGYTVNYAAADGYTMPGHLQASDISGLVAGNADPSSAWFGLVGGLAQEVFFSLVGEDDEDDSPVKITV
jgi:hypothetical protein